MRRVAQRRSEDDPDGGGRGDAQVGELGAHAEELEVDEWFNGGEDCVDQRTGEVIDPKLAAEARRAEMQLTQRIGLQREGDVKECWAETRKAPASTKWVELSKGAS